MKENKLPKIGLALSGGGAKGFAHISAIRGIEKMGLPIHCIAGTSMGALIGGWYVAGKDFNILRDLAKRGQWKRFLHFRELYRSISKDGGLFSLSYFKDFLNQEFGDLKIEDLPIKYTAVATSLETGKKVVMKSGLLSEAILASGSIPIIFAPIKRENDLLVDGGVVDNFPIEECFKMGAEFVIGIDVRFLPGYLDQVVDRENDPMQWKIFKVLNYLMEVVNEQKEVKDRKDLVVIRPYVSHVSTFDFEKIDEILKLGFEAFSEKESIIREKLKLPEPEKTLAESIIDLFK